MPWYIQQHRQWHHRGSRSDGPRTKPPIASSMEVAQGYPTNRNPRRWLNKLKSEKKIKSKQYILNDQWGDPSLILDRSFFLDE